MLDDDNDIFPEMFIDFIGDDSFFNSEFNLDIDRMGLPLMGAEVTDDDNSSENFCSISTSSKIPKR
jgi:hypothetical protein